MNPFEWLGSLLRMEPKTTGSRIVYTLPNPCLHDKFYNRDERFGCVDWADWHSVIDGFQKRFKLWYFCHIRGGHASYVDLCAICALVDAFSYYTSDKDWHDQGTYKEFLRKLDSKFRTPLAPPVSITRHRHGAWKIGKLKDVADVFYAGVRCSLHHHGDLASYAGMKGTGKLIELHSNAGTSKCGAYSYTLVVFDPAELNRKLHKWFDRYCQKLRNRPHSDAAARFRSKFEHDFGIPIPQPPTGT